MRDNQSTSTQLTQNTLLRGLITVKQFRRGNRNSLEPLLLTSAIEAKKGQRILEIGCGNGVGLLCLLARQPQLDVYGIEKDPQTAALARVNLHDNGYLQSNIVMTGSFPEDLPSLAPFDHCLANPPWHDNKSTHSPSAQRALARTSPPDLFNIWIKRAQTCLKHKGILTLIALASHLDRIISSLREAQFGDILIHPFWPKEGRRARLILVRARLHMKGGAIITAGTCLHNEDGTFTKQARRLLDAPTFLATY